MHSSCSRRARLLECTSLHLTGTSLAHLAAGRGRRGRRGRRGSVLVSGPAVGAPLWGWLQASEAPMRFFALCSGSRSHTIHRGPWLWWLVIVVPS